MTEVETLPTSTSTSAAGRRIPSPHRRSPATLLACALALVAALALAAGGCSDDDDDGDNQAQEMLLAEFQGLVSFAGNVDDGPAPQIIAHPEMANLFAVIGINLRPAQGMEGTPLTERSPWKGADPRIAHRGPTISSIAHQLPGAFGTYERDTTSVAEPFPGWVWVGSEPTDGLVFHFSEDDDFVVIENGVERHISGEIRFLNLGFGKTSVGSVVTNVLWELQVNPVSIPIVHVPFAGIPDFETGEYDRAEFGDASDLANLTNCYFGPLAFDFLSDAVDPANQQIILFAVDTTQNPDYVIHLDVEYHDLLQGSDEAHIHFGFGNSNSVTEPRNVVDALLDNFRPDPNSDGAIVDIAGTITHQGQLVATFEGTTDEVPVDFDVNGDGQVNAEDTCVDIRITFAGSNNPISICEALPGVDAGALPFTVANVIDIR